MKSVKGTFAIRRGGLFGKGLEFSRHYWVNTPEGGEKQNRHCWNGSSGHSVCELFVCVFFGKGNGRVFLGLSK